MIVQAFGTLLAGSGEQILVADDEPTIGSLTQAFLGRSGDRVTTHTPTILITGFSAGGSLTTRRAFGICDLVARPMVLNTQAAAVRRATGTSSRIPIS